MFAQIKRFSSAIFSIISSDKSSKDNIGDVETVENTEEFLRVPSASVCLDLFLKDLQLARVSESTLRNYSSDISQFLEFTHEQNLHLALSEQHFKAFFLDQQHKGLKPSTIQRRIVSLKLFSQWVEKNYLEKSKHEKTVILPIIEQEPEQVQSAPISAQPPTPKIDENDSNNFQEWALSPYFHLATLLIFFIFISILGYRQFFVNIPEKFAFPATPITPDRILSFQARLTDVAGNPITTATNTNFKLFDAVTAGNELWTSGTCSITPDQDGIFSTILGSTCGSAIASSVFTENSQVWLEVGVVSDTLTPRQRIATVPYALNSETLQGFPVNSTVSATKSSVVVMNQWGEILLGEQSPRLRSVSGTFTVSGSVLNLVTNSGSNGNIILDPDGTGIISVIGNIVNNGYLYTNGATISATYAGSTPLVINGTGGQILTVNNAGDVTTAGDIAVNGGDITSTGDITINPAGGNVIFADNAVLNIGGAAAAAYNFIAGSTAGNSTATNDNDLYIEDKFEVDGTALFDGTVTLSTLNTAGGIVYTNGSGQLLTSTVGVVDECLKSGGTGSPTWGTCSTGGLAGTWRIASGAHSPVNDTLDLLIGSTATTSAKFAVINVNSGTPTASLSAGTAGGAYLTATGTLQTTANQSLTLGGSTTGDISISPLNGGGGVDINVGAARLLNLLTGNLKVGNGTPGLTQDGEDAYIEGTFEVDGQSQFDGNVDATSGLDVTGSNLTVGGSNFTVAQASGDITTAGDIAVNGGDITSTGDLTITPAGNNVIFSDTTTLNVGGAAAAAYNFFAGSTAGNTTADGDNDLFIQDELEVDGGVRLDSTLTISSLNTAGGILYTNGSGVVSQTTVGTGGECLQSSGGGAPVWGSCTGGAVNYWRIVSGSISPVNDTIDFLVGSTATTSAKFAVINVNSGTPTATLSAGAAGGAYLTSTGTLQTTANQALAIGGSTTGDISISPLNGAGGVDVNLGATRLLNLLAGNLKVGNGTPGLTQDGEDAYIEGTFEVDGQSQFDGNVDATSGLDVTGANLTVGGANFTVAQASGDITTAGDIAVNGGDITSTGDLTITPAGGNVLFSNNTTLNVGGAAAAAFNFFADSTAGNTLADSDSDLYIQDELEVDGATRFEGAVTMSTFTANGGLLYTNGSGVLAQTAVGAAGECLQSAGGGTPTWGTCGGSNLWRIANGAISPINDTLDFLIGNTATTSAKFAVINVNSGTPTASLSAGAAGGSYLTSTGTLQTTANQALAIGGNTTGDISFSPLNGSGTSTFNGGLTQSGGTVNLNVSSNNAINLGTGSSTGTITVGGTGTQTIDIGNGAGVKTVNLGSSNSTSTTAILSGTGGLSLNSTSSNIALQTNTSGDITLTTGAAAGLANILTGNLKVGNGTPDVSLNGEDAYVEGTFEADGAVRLDSSLTISSLNTAGGILYTNGSGVVSQTTVGTGGECLQSSGGGAPVWGSCTGGAVNYWRIISGAISPVNDTTDFLVGSSATTSAKFAVINVNSGTPTATLSAGAAGGAYLTSTGTLQTTANQSLTLGGSTTGDIALSPLNGSGGVNVNLGATRLLNVLAGNLKVGNGTPGLTQDGEDGYVEGTFEVDGQSQFDGNIDATSGLDVTGANLTVGGANFTVAQATGNITTAGDIAINGGDITSTGDLTITPAGGNVIFADNTVLNVGGAAAAAFNFFADGTGGNNTADGDNDLFIQDELEVDGAARFDNASITLSAFTTDGGLLYTNATGVVSQTGTGTAGQCLKSNAGGAPTFGTCATDNYWRIANGAISPVNDTLDFLVGNTATTSAKFAVLNVNSGTPTASLSAGAAGGAYLTSTGTLQTTANQALTLGGNTTGDITLSPLNGSGTVNISGAMTVSGVTTLNGTLAANGQFTLGDNGDTGAINTNDWDISTSGDLSGIGTIAADGDVTLTQATPSILLVDSTGSSDDYSVNVDANVFNIINDTDSRTELSFAGDGGILLGDNTATKTIAIGGNTSSAADTINIGTNSTAADVITIGNSNASTTLALTGGDDWSITTTGLITTAGDIAVNGGDITSTGDLTITPAGGNVIFADNTVLNVGGAAATAYNFFAGSTAGNTTADGDNDLFIQDELEVDGAVRFDNASITMSTFTANGGLIYTNGSGVLAQTAVGNAGECLQSNAGGAPTWGSCGAGGLSGTWRISNGAHSPVNDTLDLLVGSNATASAKFAVINVNSGTPTASLSAGAAGGAYLTADGTLQSTANQSLTIGGATTGDITFSPINGGGGITANLGSARLFNLLGGNLQVGNATPTVSLNGEDAFVEGTFEVDGAVRFDNASITMSTFTANGGLIYTNGSGVLAQTAVGSAGECLQSAGGGTPTWGTCGGSNLWRMANGAISPINDTLDFLIGNSATTSAKFAVINVNSGTPTASLSAGATGGAYLTATGTLQSTANQTLTVGGSTTGDIALSPLNGSGGVNVNLGATRLMNVLTGNLKVGNGTPGLTQDGEDAYIEGTFEVDGQSQFDGNIDATSGLDVTGANLTVGGANFSVAQATGNITTAGDLAINGDDITSDGDLTITPAGGNVIFADNTVLNVGGAAATAYNFFAGSTAGNTTADGDNDLFIQDELEVDGAVRFDAGVTMSSFTTDGGLLYTNGSGVLAQTGQGTAGQCLKSNAGGAPTFGTCATDNYWRVASGAISPVNDTLDFLVGNTATTSAKFAVINVNSGTPTASLSAGATGGAYLTAAGTLQTTAGQTLNIGGDTTGNIALSARNGLGSTSITSDLAQGARSADILSIVQANNGSNNSTGNLLQLTNNDTGSTAAVIELGQNAPGGIGIEFVSEATTTLISGTSTALTTGIGLDLTTSNLTSGAGINMTGTTSGSSIAAFTGKALNVAMTRQYTGNGTLTDTGNFGNFARTGAQLTGSGTYAITGDLVKLASTCSQSGGICSDSSNILDIAQNYAAATGTVLDITNAGTGSGILLTSSSTGVLATLNSSGAVTTADGLLIAATNGAGVITDALDVSDAEIVNGINLGENFLLGNGIRQFSSSATVWTIEDTSGNDIATFTDGGTTGDLVITNTISAYGTSIGLNSDASANNTLSFGAGAGVPTGDLYWGSRLLCTAASTNCGWASTTDTTLQVAYNNDADGSDATIALNATDGSLIITPIAGTNFQVNQVTSAPTTDMVSITNAGLGTTTNGVDGLSLNFVTGDGASVTNNGLNIALTAGGSVAGDILNGINLSLTGTSGTETGINIGSGFDTGIAISSAIANEALDLTSVSGIRTTALIDINENNTSGTVPTIQWDSAETRGGLLDANLTGALGTENFIDLTASAAFTSNLIDLNIGAAAATGDVINIDLGATAVNSQALVIGNSSSIRTASMIEVNDNNSTGTVATFDINRAGTRGGIFDIDTSGAFATENLIDITTGAQAWTSNIIDVNVGAGAATGDVINIDLGATAVNSQAMVVNNTASVRTASMFEVNDNNTSGTVATFDLNGAGTRGGLFDIDWSGALTTENLIDVTANSIATANLFNLTANGLTTGKALNVSSSSTVLTTGGLGAFDWSPSGSTEIYATGSLVNLNIGQYANLSHIFNVQDNGSDVFSVNQSIISNNLPVEFTAPGDVSVAYDLEFTNQVASFIKTSAPLTIETGESFENNDLTLKTYGTGALVVSATGGSEFTRSAGAVASFNRTTSDGTVISIQQDGTEEGTISVSTTTVSYNAFTGSHYALVEDANEMGELVTMTSNNQRLGGRTNSEIIYGAKKSVQANDPKVLGAYLALLNPDEPESLTNPYLIMAVGNGEMWVADNGENIDTGDYMISSSTPGHAMKDVGMFNRSHIIARAAEPVDWSTVSEDVNGIKHKRISVFFENFTRDNNLNIAADGSLLSKYTIQETAGIPTSRFTVIKDASGQVVETISAFAKVIVGEIQAGLIQSQQIITSTLTVQDSLTSPKVETNLISPISGEELEINIGEEADDTLEVTNNNNETVLSIDQSGNATFSGTVNAPTGRFEQLQAQKATLSSLEVETATISGLLYLSDGRTINDVLTDNDTYLASLSAQTEQITQQIQQTPEAVSTSSFNEFLSQLSGSADASVSAALATLKQQQNITLTEEDMVLAPDAIFVKEYLGVNGFTQLTTANVQNSLSIGSSMVLTDNSIAAVDTVLFLQPQRGVVNLNAGMLVLKNDGNLEINGDLLVNGNVAITKNLNTNSLSPLDYSSDFNLKLASGSAEVATQSAQLNILGANDASVASINASGSARFKDLQTQGIIINQPEAAATDSASLVENEKNKTVGNAVIPAGSTEIVIDNNLVTSDTLIYLTATSNTSNQVLYQKEIETCSGSFVLSTCKKSFTVGIQSPVTTDIQFNYWLIQQK